MKRDPVSLFLKTFLALKLFLWMDLLTDHKM